MPILGRDEQLSLKEFQSTNKLIYKLKNKTLLQLQMHKRSPYFDYSQNPSELCINPYEQFMHFKLHKATQMKSQTDANPEAHC